MKKYTKEEFELAFKQIWSRVTFNKTTILNNMPIGIIVGGQSGAGKSTIAKQILKQDPNIVLIDMDLCKTFHPKFKQIMLEQQEEAHKTLKGFAMKLRNDLLNEALKNKYNVLVETTFNSSKTPIDLLKLFKNNNYKTNIIIQTCHKDISWQSCCEIAKITNRYVDKDFHDTLITKLATNIKEVQDSGLADNIKIYSRILDKKLGIFNQVEIYNSDLKPKVNIATINKYLGLERKLNLENSYNFD